MTPSIPSRRAARSTENAPAESLTNQWSNDTGESTESASFPFLTGTVQPFFAEPPPQPSTIEPSVHAVVGTSTVTWKPSASSTTTPDTASELSGYEDLIDMLNEPYERFLEWAALRVMRYREAVAMHAATALSELEGDGKRATVTAAEWEATAATSGETKSYPFEAVLINLILEGKQNAR